MLIMHGELSLGTLVVIIYSIKFSIVIVHWRGSNSAKVKVKSILDSSKFSILLCTRSSKIEIKERILLG